MSFQINIKMIYRNNESIKWISEMKSSEKNDLNMET